MDSGVPTEEEQIERLRRRVRGAIHAAILGGMSKEAAEAAAVPGDGPRFRLLTMADLERSDLFWNLPQKHALHPAGGYVDHDLQTIELFWGNYRYQVDLDRVTSQMDVFRLLEHIGHKGWDGGTPERMVWLMKTLLAHLGIQLYPEARAVEPKEAADERAKMTPKLRFAVLARNQHRCVSCGNGPPQGAFLHVDHIVPIARGGKTTLENLQTLCAACNLGKGTTAR